MTTQSLDFDGLRRLARIAREVLAAVLFALAVPAGAAQSGDPGQAIAEGAPVRIWNQTIVVLRAKTDVGPEIRAARAARRIQSIPEELARYEIKTEPINIGQYSGIAFVHDGKILFGITQADLDPQESLTLAQAAARAKTNIEHWLGMREEQHNPNRFVRHLLLVMVSTAVFVGLLFGAIRFTDFWHERRTQAAADTARSIVIAGVNFRPYLITLELGVLRLVAWGVYLALTYLWLTYALSQFPYTRGWGSDLAGFLTQIASRFGSAILGAIPNLFAVLIIFVLARLVTGIVGGFFKTVERGAVHLSWMQPEIAHVTRRICVAVVWLFAIVMAYPYIPGSDSDAFKGLSVLVGLMISLGSAGLVGQVMGGFVVVYNGALRVGEWVRIGEHEGRITEIGMLSTRLLTLRNEVVTIPNAVLVSGTATNFSRRAKDLGAVVTTSVSIGYDTPWRQVHAMLIEAARRTASVPEQPRPRVLQRSLQDFYVHYDLIVPLLNPEARYATLSELHAHIQDVFNEHGVQIMSPHFVAQPDQAVVVAKENWSPPPANPA